MNWQTTDVKKVLVSEEEIAKITTELAARISADYKDKNLVLLGVLKGSLPFMADIMRKLTIPAELEFMKVSSYGGGTVSTGEIKIHLDIMRDDLKELDILIVEDIIDSGRTLLRLRQLLLNRGARSVRSVTMLDKPCRRAVEFEADYVGKTVPDEFVVGYGLDYDEKYRTLPFIGVLA